MPKYFHTILVQDYHPQYDFGKLMYSSNSMDTIKYFVNQSVGALRARILPDLFIDGSQTLKMVPGT